MWTGIGRATFQSCHKGELVVSGTWFGVADRGRAGEGRVEVGEEKVNSQSRAADCTAYCTFAASMQLPSMLGWSPSLLKKSESPQNRLKLSIKPMLKGLHADWRQLWRLSNLLKHPAPWTTVVIGPEIKTDFPQALKKDKRPLKSFLVSSDCSQAKSLVLT